MSLDTSVYEKAITDRLEELCPRVFVTEVPDNQESPKLPYIMVQWIEPIRAAGGHHLENSRHDAQRAGFILTTVSKTDEDANRLKNAARNSLLGWQPPDCNDIKAEGGRAFSMSNAIPRPTTYSRMQFFSFITNLSWD